MEMKEGTIMKNHTNNIDTTKTIKKNLNGTMEIIIKRKDIRKVGTNLKANSKKSGTKIKKVEYLLDKVLP